MTRRRIEALLLSTILTITTCLPMNTLSAYAAESAPADSTEVAAVQEAQTDGSKDSDAEEVEATPADNAEAAEPEEGEEEIQAEESDIEQTEEPEADQPEEISEETEQADDIQEDEFATAATEEAATADVQEAETDETVEAPAEDQAVETAAAAATETAAEVEEPESEEVEVKVTTDIGGEISLDDSDVTDKSAEDLLAEYIGQEMGLTSSVEAAKYRKKDAGARLKGINRLMYDEIAGQLESIAAGSRTSTKFEIPISVGDKWYADAEDLGVSKVLDYNSSTGGYLVNAEALKALYQPYNVLIALITDYPYEMYWFNKTVGNLFPSVIDDMDVSGMLTTDGKQYFVIKGITNKTVSMSVLKEYSLNGDSYSVDPATGEAVRNAVANADTIVNKYSSSSDYDRLKGYCTDICDLVSYDYKAQSNSSYSYSGGNYYGDPWQLVYVFDGDTSTNVVCEGYAKAFQYLCDKTTFNNDSITCMSVSGGMDGYNSGHMWNIVTMDDGANYLVDVTNCDSGSVGAPYELFLAGTTGSVAYGYKFFIEPFKNAYYAYSPDKTAIYSESELTLADHYYGKKSITNIGVTFDDYVYYNGKVQKPNFTVTSKTTGKTLVKGTDYDVYYYEPDPKTAGLEEQNVAPGVDTGAFQIIGKGEYYGRQLVNFSITCDLDSDLCEAAVAAKVKYTGKALKPAVTVIYNGVTLKEGTDYTLTYSNNKNAGIATVTVAGVAGRVDGSFDLNFEITKASQPLTLKKNSKVITKGKTISIAPGSKYQYKVTGATTKLTVKSSNTKVAKATINKKGVITVKALKYGTAKITVTAAKSTNYKAATSYIKVKIVPAATTKLTATSLNARGFKLKWAEVPDSDGYVIYRTVINKNGTTSTKKLKTINNASTVTYTDKAPKKNGLLVKYTVKATSGKLISTLSRSITTYRLNRAKISSCKKTAATKLAVKWNKNTIADGFEVQYSLSENFKKSTKTVKFPSGTTKATLTGLKSGQTYYVRVRAYKKYGKTKSVSAWSTVKTAK